MAGAHLTGSSPRVANERAMVKSKSRSPHAHGANGAAGLDLSMRELELEVNSLIYSLISCDKILFRILDFYDMTADCRSLSCGI